LELKDLKLLKKNRFPVIAAVAGTQDTRSLEIVSSMIIRNYGIDI
jgi:hypothetical protein